MSRRTDERVRPVDRVRAGCITDASPDPASTLGRVVWSLARTTPIRVLCLGDSMTTGSNAAPGANGTRLYELARAAGIPIRLVGPVSRQRAGYPVPADPMCAGYPGETQAQLTVRCQAAGSVYTYVTAFGAPDVVIVRAGTNDASAGDSAATMRTHSQALVAAVRALCPNAWIIVESIPLFYLPFAPTGGLSAANAIIATFNGTLATDATAGGYTFLDACAGFGLAEAWTDGEHLRYPAHAMIASREFSLLRTRYAVSQMPAMPRPFRMRTKQASAKFTTKTTDQIKVSTDNAWRLPAGNFLAQCRINPTTLITAGTITGIMQATPLGYGYNHGWGIHYDSTVNPPTVNVYGMGAGALCSAQTPMVIGAGALYWLFAHGDRVNGIVSIWLAMPASTAPGAQWTVACVGVAQGVAAWAQGDASPDFTVGKNQSEDGFAGSIDNIAFYATNVPGFESIRDVIESIVFDGASPLTPTAWLPCDEGSGASCASLTGGSAGTLVGGWSTAGTLAWPCDE